MENILKIRDIVLGEGTPKICVPLVGMTQDEIYEEAESIKAMSVDMAEWRADWFESVNDLEKVTEIAKKLRTILKDLPLIFTFRTEREGGNGKYSKEEYHNLLMAVASRTDLDLIDVELFSGDLVVAELINSIHRTGRFVIASSHDFAATPRKSEIVCRLCKMQDLGADILKIAVMPNCRKDVLTLMEATLEMQENHARRPLITMSMGADGVISRLSGEITGSAITFAAAKQASAPGQIRVEEVRRVLNIVHDSCYPNHIFLSGFMGTGKTTVSSWLSEELGMAEVDTDKRIEAEEGRTIAKMFERFGEEYFRDKETALLESLKNEMAEIISCGGGMVLRHKNARLMKQQGRIVLLTASPQTIYNRVKNSKSRPLLNDDMSVEHIQELMEKRQAAYKSAADIIVKTDGKTIEQIGQEIIEKLKR